MRRPWAFFRVSDQNVRRTVVLCETRCEKREGVGGAVSRLIVTGGTIATAEGKYRGDIVCESERIAAIVETAEPRPDDRVVDATGLVVLPGGIDAHTHFDEPFMGCVSADNFTDGGRAALAGGITSHVDFAYQFAGETLEGALRNWQARATGRAVIDYGIHIVITDPTDAVKAEIPRLVELGCPTFKIFMTYPGLAVDDGNLMDLLRITTHAGGRISVHAENYHVSDRLVAALQRVGRTQPRWHPHAHPWQSEYEATVRAMALAQLAEAPLYVVHMSAAQAVDAVSAARDAGQEVVGETSISYLALTDDVFDTDEFDAAKYICTPPPRDLANQDKLWHDLQHGSLQIVASDHDPFNMADRHRLGGDDFSKIPNGIAGIEQIRPLLWTEGVATGRLSLERLVQVTATNPARALGLWPRKGAIMVGSDADLVVWDPRMKVRLGLDTTHSAADYCVYEGRSVTGYPVVTISRGEVVYDHGDILAEPGRGRFVERGHPLFV